MAEFIPQLNYNSINKNISTNSNKYDNIVLCYHGIAMQEKDKNTFVTYIEDFKKQINHLKDYGFTFVSPTAFAEWFEGKSNPDTPIATIIFDDGFASIKDAANWLIENKITFGMAIIGSRNGKVSPEDGYISWTDLETITNSGLCEILSHTYDIHHFCLKTEGSEIVSAPILEGPCYVDDGEFLYIKPGDTRWYWERSHVEGVAWAFPLLGTDSSIGKAISSTIKFKASKNLTINKIRVLSCLHEPYSSGYSANVKISINGTQVANTTVAPVQYETRSQWPEREFVTINLNKSYKLSQGKDYTIKFETLNTGNSTFRIYAIPDFSGNYQLDTTCTGHDYPENKKWPARPCIILAGSSGRNATEEEFKAYISKDLSENNNAINEFLKSAWTGHSTGYNEQDPLEVMVIGGTYSDGSTAKTQIKFHANENFTADAIKFKYASKQGVAYSAVIDIYIDDIKVGTFTPNWWEWHWQTIEISPFQFIGGQDYIIRFETKNASPYGMGLMRIYLDQPSPPQPTWDSSKATWTALPDSAYQHEMWYEVSNQEGTDVYPDGAIVSGVNYSWKYNAPYDGPGRAFLELLSYTSEPSMVPTQICYPFGSYYSTIVNNKEDIHTSIKEIFAGLGMTSGYSLLWDDINENNRISKARTQYTEYLIPRYLVYGNKDLSLILQDIDNYTGIADSSVTANLKKSAQYLGKSIKNAIDKLK